MRSGGVGCGPAVVEGTGRSGGGDAGAGPSDGERPPACSSSDPDPMPSPDDGGAAGRRSGARWSRPDIATRPAERWRSRVLPAPAITAHADPAVVAGPRADGSTVAGRDGVGSLSAPRTRSVASQVTRI